MKTYRISDIYASLGIFLDEEYEGNDEMEVIDTILNEIIDNIGNYIDIELDEVENEEGDENEEF